MSEIQKLKTTYMQTIPSEKDFWLMAGDYHCRGETIMRNTISDLRSGRELNLSIITAFISDLMKICFYDESHFITLARIKESSKYHLCHPFNVCVYSMAIAKAMGFSDKQIAATGIAGFLHDIGEIKLPERVILKTAKYTESEYAAMQRHPELGYEILKKEGIVSEDILMGVLQHHERIDGSGYPSGFNGKYTNTTAKIISVAEVFNSITTPRYNNQAMNQQEALKMLYSQSDRYFDPTAVQSLVATLGMYPVGSAIRLDNGQLGIVLTKNRSDLTKPRVIIIRDSNNQPIEPFIVDLEKDLQKRKIVYTESSINLDVDVEKLISVFLHKI